MMEIYNKYLDSWKYEANQIKSAYDQYKFWCDKREYFIKNFHGSSESEMFATILDRIVEQAKFKIDLERKQNISQKEPSRAEKFTAALRSNGFFELDKMRTVDSEKIVNVLLEKDLPFNIAFMDFVGFIVKVELESGSKKKRDKAIASILNSNDRAIKGNIAVLGDISKEDRNRYTAHLHKEEVIKTYQNLK